MKMIAVTNERGNVLAPTYPRRAKYLIKHGRAKTNGDDAIILLTPPKNIDISKYETHFVEYLIEQKRTQNSIDNFMGEFESFCTIQPNPEEIGKFAWRKGGVTGVKPTYSFLEAFADFCEARKDEHLELPLFGDAIRIHIHDHFEGEAWQAVTNYKNTMVFIPKDTQIDPQYLGGLTNEEYVKAFGDLQRLIYAFYEAIESGSPFEWGWADWSRLTVYGTNHNRVIRTIHILSDSDLVDDKLVVEKKTFFAYDDNKPQVVGMAMLKRFSENGLTIEGMDDKKEKFSTISYPQNPHLIRVWSMYFQNRLSGCNECKQCKNDGCWKYWSQRHARILSYRFVEAVSKDIESLLSPSWTNAVENNAAFFAKTDSLPENLREIHYEMYKDACKVGIWVEPFYDMFSDSIVYAKGTWKSHKRLIFSDKGTITIRFEKLLKKYPDKKIEIDKLTSNTWQGDTISFQCTTLESAMFLWECFKLKCGVKSS